MFCVCYLDLRPSRLACLLAHLRMDSSFRVKVTTIHRIRRRVGSGMMNSGEVAGVEGYVCVDGQSGWFLSGGTSGGMEQVEQYPLHP